MVDPLKEGEQEVASDNIDNLVLIQKFYYGQNIFIIQRTVFIGKLVIEQSLRIGLCMNSIYLSIRSEKDSLPNLIEILEYI
ncbi:hypothetical protein HZH68_003917 [Vespula germanica]|uniref:Uncharacterized protein n=1 Tax=Vespula germanica TaxID=30212 RepID=A0A834KMM4_VESGE|nr:hypothetical protein HZH68_003917 [Vespula germanica]